MGVPSIVYEWKSLRTIYIAVFLMNITGCVIMAILAMTAAAKLRGSGMRVYLDLAVPGAAFFWPWMMILTAFFCGAIYAIGFKICLRLQKFANAESSLRLNNLLLTHCALCFSSAIFEIGLAAIWVHQVMNIDRRLETGIWDHMRDYPTDLTAKTKVDTMQLELSCCGSESFEDWLDLGWSQAHQSGEIRDESLTAASTGVPFSCCVTETLSPCVHHGIDMPNEVYNLDRRLTISRIGCRAKLLSQMLHHGGLTIVAFISLSIYQMILAVLSRLLQTAHSNNPRIGSGRGRYLAWIFGSSPGSGKYNRLVGPERVAKIPSHRGFDAPLQKGEPSYCARVSSEADTQNLTNETCTNKIQKSPPSSGTLSRQSCIPAAKEITPVVKPSTKDWGGPSESELIDQVRLDSFKNCPKEDQLQRSGKFRENDSPCYNPNDRPEAELSDVRCSWSRNADVGRLVQKNEVCSCGNKDTFCRFNGSVRDDSMRRNCQIIPPLCPRQRHFVHPYEEVDRFRRPDVAEN